MRILGIGVLLSGKRCRHCKYKIFDAQRGNQFYPFLIIFSAFRAYICHSQTAMRLHFFLLLSLILISCSDDEKRSAETLRDREKKESVFKKIDSAWRFNSTPQNPVAKDLTNSWEQWRMFLGELSQKPQSSISAFRKKSATLSKSVADLATDIPATYDRPEIRARIGVLTTKVNALDLYLHLDEIPADKAIAQITGINAELSALQVQMAEIVRKSQIPREEGELDMIRMLDTARAIPSPVKPTLPKPELRGSKSVFNGAR
jgi:hypothetical protein